MKRTTVLILAIALVVIFGCQPKPVYQPLPERAGATLPEKDERGSSVGTEQQGQKGKEGGITEEDLLKREEEARRRALAEAAAASPLKDIYFDFDSYALTAEALPLLKEIGTWLNRNKSVQLSVEGHCDERGTTEYNMALGQKRADAVKEQLVRLGIDGKRLRTISYGKEAPAVPGHDEEAWSKNRRAHFKVE